MQHKLITNWGGGIIEVDGQTREIVIKQGTNVIRVGLNDHDNFIADFDAAMQVAVYKPTGVGFGGTILPIAPKPTGQKPKSIWDIVDDIENVVNPHT